MLSWRLSYDSGHSQHFVRPVDPILSGLAGGEARDAERVLGVPGVSPHRRTGRSVAHTASEPVLAGPGCAGAGDTRGAAQAGYGERTSGGGRGSQRVLRG